MGTELYHNFGRTYTCLIDASIIYLTRQVRCLLSEVPQSPKLGYI